MFYVKGDCHGDYSILYHSLKRMKETERLKPQDSVILLGDHGLNYFYKDKDNVQKDLEARDQLGALSRVFNVNFLLIHGNHDGYRPEHAPELYEEVEYCEAAAWHFKDKNLSCVYYAKFGEMYDLDGQKAVVLDGAYSVDKFLRLIQGWQWFSDEQPTGKMRQYAESNLEAAGWKVDYVLSHTAPFSAVPRDMFLKGYSEREVDNGTEKWLESIYRRLDFRHWYCGHFHEERDLTDKVTLLYHQILPLGKRLRK